MVCSRIALVLVLAGTVLTVYGRGPKAPFDVRVRANNESQSQKTSQSTSIAPSSSTPTTPRQSTPSQSTPSQSTPSQNQIDQRQSSQSGQNGGAAGDSNQGSKSCGAFNRCWDDKDCGEGKCVGFSVGKCACTCANFVACSSDGQCGGLVGACNKGTGKCDCDAAYEKHGFGSVFTRNQQLCSQKACHQNSNDCFGLPCGGGNCACPFGK